MNISKHIEVSVCFIAVRSQWNFYRSISDTKLIFVINVKKTFHIIIGAIMVSMLLQSVSKPSIALKTQWGLAAEFKHTLFITLNILHYMNHSK